MLNNDWISKFTCGDMKPIAGHFDYGFCLPGYLQDMGDFHPKPYLSLCFGQIIASSGIINLVRLISNHFSVAFGQAE